MRVFAALRRSHLRALWIGLVLSAIGDSLYGIATVWIAVEAVGASAGIVSASQAVATLLLAPFGGVLADRLDRRRTLIAADLLRALVVATLPVAAAFGTIGLPHLIVVALLLGAMNAMFIPALQASLPALTENAAELHAMNALHDSTFRIARAVGPSLAGILAVAISVPHFFTVDAISFLVSAAAVISVGRHFEWRARAGDGPAPSGFRGALREIAGALELVRAHRALAFAFPGLILINAAWCCAFTIGGALFASRVLASDVGAYGALVGAYGFGNIASNLVVGSFTLRRRAPLLFLGHVILGLGFIGFALAPTLHVAMALTALAAMGGPIGSLALVSTIQEELPRAQIGKVFSLRMCMEYGGVSLGLLGAAPMFALLSVRTGIALCAAAMALYGASGLARFARA